MTDTLSAEREERKKYYKAYRERRNWERQARGVCQKCENPHIPGQVLCVYHRDYGRNWRQSARQIALDHYGHACACCGEDEETFLSFDHMDNGGNEHRRSTGMETAKWLVKNGFPERFQTLCYNCNLGRQINGGVCPHEEESRRTSLLCVDPSQDR